MPETKSTPPHFVVRNERFFDKPLGFIAALIAHAVLILGLITVFQWNTASEMVYAELWAPEDVSGKVTSPVTEVTPEPEPETVKPTQADIEERVAREAQIRLEEEKKAREREKAAEEKLKAEQAAAEARRLEAEKQKRLAEEKRRQEQLRQAELARILGVNSTDKATNRVGQTTGDMRVKTPNATGTRQTRYIARVVSLLRSQIIYQVPAGLKSGEHLAIYTVFLLPDGSQVKPPQLEQSSGLPAFDAAVESAIRRVDPFPAADPGQTLPKTIRITFDPVESSQ